MRHFKRLLVFSLLALLVAGPLFAGEREDALDAQIGALEKVVAALRSTTDALTGLAKVQIDHGDLRGVEGTVNEIRAYQESLAEFEAQLLRARAQRRPVIEPVGPAAAAVVPPVAVVPGEAGGGAGHRWFGGRGGHRNLRAEGGSAATQGAVDLAHMWLKNHQDPEGHWDADGFSKQCRLNQCDGAGNSLYDPGLTGLALMAFLGAGETDAHGNYKPTIRKGLDYLASIQDEEGCIGPRTTNHFTYNHAFAAHALAEAWALTGDPRHRKTAQKAVDFLLMAQNPYLAWRYGVRPGDNDTSVTSCVVSALFAAKMGGLRVDQAAFDGAKAWIDKVTEPEYGRIGYTARGTGPARPQDVMDKFPSDKSEALTAAGIFMRVLCGENPRKSEMFMKGADLMLKALPVWDLQSGSIDMYYWHFGTLAMHQAGGDSWKEWNEALKPAIVDHQRKDGDEKGSWDPVGPWGRDGGRIYSTALSAMMMESYYRHGRLFSSSFRRFR